MNSRRLFAEKLEPRLLLAAIRVANYNVLNNPSNGTEDAYFSTIFQAIGTESKAGIARPVDLLILEETDATSASRIEAVLDSLYVDEYARVVSPSYSGDAFGFVYNTATIQLLSSSNLPNPGGVYTRPPLLGHFQPIGASGGDADFWAYALHLKAGQTGSDASIRATEAAAIHTHANSLGDGENVIIAGDFNVYTSSELGYSNFLASGAGQVFDPISTPGSWNNNAAFKAVHTQDPSGTIGGMDDRFDFQLISGELFSSLGGLDFVPGTYRAFGNNNTHAINQPITSGSGASVTVLNALRDASDHLPIIVDYQFSTGPTVGLSLDGNTSLSVTEGGVTDSYTIALTSVPTADVVVTIDPDNNVDLGNGPGVPTVRTFTPGNALIPQPINVIAVDDLVAEGVHIGAIVHTISSADASYNVLTIANALVTIIDNDTASVSVVQSSGSTSVAEGSVTDLISLSLTSIPLSNVTVTITPNSQIDLGNGAGVAVSRLFTPANALTVQDLSVVALDDLVLEGTHAGLLTFSVSSTDLGYNGMSVPSVNVGVTDNDFISVVGEIEEFGGPGQYTIDFFATMSGAPLFISIFELPLAFNVSGVTFSGSVGDFTPNPAFASETVVAIASPSGYLVSGSSGSGLSLQPGQTVKLFSIVVTASITTTVPSLTEVVTVIANYGSGEIFYDANFEAIPESGTIVVSGGKLSPSVAPRILDVVVGGSAWTAPFLDAVDGTPGNGLGLSLPGANQLRNLPWTNLNRIYIRFSENIGTFTETSLSIVGVNTANYAGSFTVAYNPGTFLATISSATAFTADKLLITIPTGTVSDLAGNDLDGEWTDSVSTVSGNGTAGGTFSFRMDVVPGDTNLNDNVSAQDVLQTNARPAPSVTDPLYSLFHDVNGSGSINASDVLLVNGRSGQNLPGGNPVSPPIAPPRAFFAASTNDSNAGIKRKKAGASNEWSLGVDSYFEDSVHVERRIEFSVRILNWS